MAEIGSVIRANQIRTPFAAIAKIPIGTNMIWVFECQLNFGPFFWTSPLQTPGAHTSPLWCHHLSAAQKPRKPDLLSLPALFESSCVAVKQQEEAQWITSEANSNSTRKCQEPKMFFKHSSREHKILKSKTLHCDKEKKSLP
jgi:NAD-dependent oxidoreductase involved in siderophore biosynthesis